MVIEVTVLSQLMLLRLNVILYTYFLCLYQQRQGAPLDTTTWRTEQGVMSG